jgi:hypothetical protein
LTLTLAKIGRTQVGANFTGKLVLVVTVGAAICNVHRFFKVRVLKAKWFVGEMQKGSLVYKSSSITCQEAIDSNMTFSSTV